VAQREPREAAHVQHQDRVALLEAAMNVTVDGRDLLGVLVAAVE
jgi:hypothetical protein